jgi:hypothetical protein
MGQELYNGADCTIEISTSETGDKAIVSEEAPKDTIEPTRSKLKIIFDAVITIYSIIFDALYGIKC